MKVLSVGLLTFFAMGCAGFGTSSGDDQLFVPEGWTHTSINNTTHLVAPENNLSVWYTKTNVSNDTDFSALSLQLWKLKDSGFSWQELAKSEPPTEKWDRIVRIVYNTPAEKNMTVLTTFKIKGQKAWVTMLSSDNATLNKRGAQLSQSAVTFRPKSLGDEEDFSTRKPKPFAEIEKPFVEFVAESQKKLGVPGVAIGIWQNGKVVFNSGFGVTNLDNPKPVDSNTLFMIGSVTKPLSTLMMSKLIQEGKLYWSDPLTRHLTGWKLNSPEATQSILMEHTACACTGMPRRDLDFLFEIDGKSPEMRMREMAAMGPTTKPGETFQYSNNLVAAGGYGAAKTYAPGRTLNEAYSKAMSDLVFKPLAMERTFIANTSPYRENSAWPHSIDIELAPRRIGTKIEEAVNAVSPAGSVWSTTTDMLKYVELEITQGASRPGYLRKDLLLSRRKEGVKITEKVHYGKGLFIQEAKKVVIVGHDGNTLGQTASMGFYPEKNLGFVILSNLQGANSFADLLTDQLFELMFEGTPTTAKTLEFLVAEREKGKKRLKKLLKEGIKDTGDLVGTYNSNELGRMVLKRAGKKWMADFGEWSSELRELNDKGESRAFLLTSPPWNGGLTMVKDGSGFYIEAAQSKYQFKKIR